MKGGLCSELLDWSAFRRPTMTRVLPETVFGTLKPIKGKYKVEKNKIIFLDKPYDNDFIPDTIYIFDDKIIMELDSLGKPIIKQANHFLIKRNELK